MVCSNNYTNFDPTTFYLTDNGDLYGCSKNTDGQLGTGTAPAVQEFVYIPGGPWKQVVSFPTVTFAIKTDNTLWSWGKNLNGLLGQGLKTQSLVPTKISDEFFERNEVRTFAIFPPRNP